jgi:hypothetical protein
MKKLLTIAGILASLSSFGQLVHENKYSNCAGSNTHVENVEGEGHKYVYINKANSSLDIHNTDHSLFKSIPLAPSGTIIGSNRNYLSKTLFNSDNKLEFIVAYSNGGGSYTAYLINEDGMVLQTFDKSTGGEVSRVGSSYKLITTEYDNGQLNSNVWSLPGQYTGMKPEPRLGGETEIFPNPVETTATITYTLPVGKRQAPLRIYNAAGVLVKEMIVTDQFKDVLIFRGDLPSGNYVYEVGVSKSQFMVN